MIGEAVRSDDFRVFTIPENTRNLTLRVDSLTALARVHVPDLDRAIRSTATSCKHAILPRAPGHPFNGSFMRTVGQDITKISIIHDIMKIIACYNSLEYVKGS